MLPGDVPERTPRELRVKLDPELHEKLYRLKLLRNKSMTDAIHEALEHYFAAVVAPKEEDRLPPEKREGFTLLSEDLAKLLQRRP